MNHTKNDIYTRIHTVLVEQFEMDADSISMDAKLRDDLDIDSIDAVDLMVELKSFTEKKLAVDDFREVRTISDIVDAVHKLAQENSTAT
ncbi:acyl carrier protein [Pseudomonadales bacterium]|nr:acyl carrier protein [Pseudomonadales bacterium]MDB4430641.1 acyl carrier protein [bacterium]